MENKYEKYSKDNPRGALSLEFSSVLGADAVANHIMVIWNSNHLKNMSQEEKYNHLRKDFQNFVAILAARSDEDTSE